MELALCGRRTQRAAQPLVGVACATGAGEALTMLSQLLAHPALLGLVEQRGLGMGMWMGMGMGMRMRMGWGWG